LTAFVTVSGCEAVRRTGCLAVGVARAVVLRAAGLVLDGVAAAVDSRDVELERAGCRLGLEVVQAARPITKSPARRILDISPPTAESLGAI
jgi:hypothetical protein